MDIRTDELRVVDLADEFGITISETLALCKMFDIPAPYGSSVLTPAGADLLRGLARGDIDPDVVDATTLAEARGPSYEPAAGRATISSAGSFDSSQLQVASPAGEGKTTESVDFSVSSTSFGEDVESDTAANRDFDGAVDASGFDDFGVSGLGELAPKRKPKPKIDSRVTNVAPSATLGGDPTRVASLADPSDGNDDGSGPSPGSSGSASVTSGILEKRAPVRPVQERGPERRHPRPRRDADAQTEAAKKDYNPKQLRAEYDDIDKYVPKWLKYIALVAIAVFGFIAYNLLTETDAAVVNDDVASTTPLFSPGDCFNADVALWIDTIVTVPCAGEHMGEVFDVYRLPGDELAAYPAKAAMESSARQACRGTFVSYTGQSSIGGSYIIGVSVPSALEWGRGDRFAYCSTLSGSGELLTGSSAG